MIRKLLKLRREANKLMEKYNPQTLEDLEGIAREEYCLNVSRTSEAIIGALGAAAIIYQRRRDGQYAICYYPYPSSEKKGHIVLAHEIGHWVAGHLKTPTNSILKEIEADYFSRVINKMSWLQFEVKRCEREGLEEKNSATKLYNLFKTNMNYYFEILKRSHQPLYYKLKHFLKL